VNTTKFFELLEALNSNQGIYEQQIVRRQGEKMEESPSKGHIHGGVDDHQMGRMTGKVDAKHYHN